MNMGWGRCGKDKDGREIGYMIESTCDHPGCKKKIDRGLYFVCGGMHGGAEHGCGKYFCDKHIHHYRPEGEKTSVQLCKECVKINEEAE
jgi:hypothetical protein